MLQIYSMVMATMVIVMMAMLQCAINHVRSRSNKSLKSKGKAIYNKHMYVDDYDKMERKHKLKNNQSSKIVTSNLHCAVANLNASLKKLLL